MRLIAAFFRLVRLPNLIFIALTQFLFQFTIIIPLFEKAGTKYVFDWLLLCLFILSSVLIAAGGYIINDYFDINIDQVNKPKKNVVDIIISRRWAMFWHSAFSFIGVLLGFYIGWMIGVFWIGIMNLICSLLLFAYSASFKKKLLSGNISISLLTAWAVAVLGLATFYRVYYNEALYSLVEKDKLLRLTVLYAAFAFIISLIREAIKDMQDLQGDLRYGCKTMPIVWGVNAAKIYVAVWQSVLIGALVIVQLYVIQYTWWWPALYSFILIIFPLIWSFIKLTKANTAKEFHALSSLTKFIMFTGVLSMIFFRFYL